MDNTMIYKELANAIRGISIDGIGLAKSGHPGLPLGMADVATVLWAKYLKHNPNNPNWYDRDRFVLSAGHGSMLIYSLLHLFGYDMPVEELRNFRQWGSDTPGHPENFITEGVETTTGPLGQGLANGVGMALAEVSLATRFNKNGHNITNHYTYVIAGDGDLQEGISHEVCSFAGHNQLGKLIVFYDNNNISIDGKTDLSYSDNTKLRFNSYHWDVFQIDGHHTKSIENAIEQAQKTPKPSLIICDTKIGYGSPNREGTSKAHGEPFPEEEIKLTKEALGIPVDAQFYVSEEAGKIAEKTLIKGADLEKQWREHFKNYQLKYPELATQFKMCLDGKFGNKNLDIPEFPPEGEMATRTASGTVLNYIEPHIPSLIGGSADLTPSNNTLAKTQIAFSTKNQKGRYIHYGVREHGMGGIMNGMALHGGVIPYAGTFFVFSDYMRPAMRMAALMRLQCIYVLTHDSIGLGEDGPTHQPVAHLTSFRAMPNILVLRPMDANETVMCWKVALEQKKGPTCLVLTRQKLPVYDRKKLEYASAENTKKGAYVLTEDKDFSAIVMSSGSEVEIALQAKENLNQKGIKVRVVSVPSFELFEQQSNSYKREILPTAIRVRSAVEAGASLCWWKYVGSGGKVIGLDRFGGSAPYKTLYDKFGITAKAVTSSIIQQRKGV
ncbi:transketolase [Elysia marginata]|uniref:Transketolase n=1 Tax=Elysia marginata TaxID=1093978 RepID=A0AAV4FP10_9GAST|nr:transketolase [Elysia marginata]